MTGVRPNSPHTTRPRPCPCRALADREQGAQGAVEQGQVLAELAEVVAVVVPAAEAESDDARACLDETAGGEEMVGEAGAAVVAVFVLALAVASGDAAVLAGKVERLQQLWAGEHAERLLVEGVHALHEAGGVEVAAQLVEALEQTGAVMQAVERHAAQGHVIGAAAAVRLEGACATPR